MLIQARLPQPSPNLNLNNCTKRLTPCPKDVIIHTYTNKTGVRYASSLNSYYACGFAWVNVFGVRSNSKLGKWLAAAGFRKDYTGALTLWNPSGFPTQSISILEAGAEAYAQVLKDKLGLDKVYAGSRMD